MGINSASAVTACNWYSKVPRMTDASKPEAMPTSSQGIRALVWANTESSAPTSLDIPDAS